MTEALKRKLTNAGRVLTSQDQGDFVAGHVTVRLPDDPGRFLMKPATIGLDEMTLDNIITVDLEGQKVGGTMPRHNEVFIHSEVLRARPEIQCVIHTHAPHAVAFSSLGRELVPVNNEAGYFYKQLPIFSETSDLIVTQGRGKSVARCLGQHGALILRNHGIVTAGRSIEEAVWIALKLERPGQLGKREQPLDLGELIERVGRGAVEAERDRGVEDLLHGRRAAMSENGQTSPAAPLIMRP